MLSYSCTLLQALRTDLALRTTTRTCDTLRIRLIAAAPLARALPSGRSEVAARQEGEHRPARLTPGMGREYLRFV